MFSNRKFFLWSLLLLGIPCVLFAGNLSYRVDFEGLDDSSTLKAMRMTGQLSSLKKRPPASINALRYRAESDIPEWLKILHAHGYYEAEIQIRLQEGIDQVRIIVLIDPGPVYQIGDFQIALYCPNPDCPVEDAKIKPQELGITVGKAVEAAKILNAEQRLLQLLSEQGYPLAQIEKREMIADGKLKTLSVLLAVNVGPKTSFGSTQVLGLETVSPLFIEKKTAWKQNALYNSHLVEKTQNTLLDTGLFSSVLITHEEALNSDGELPMKIELKETKHRSLNIGVSYQTVFGPGITFGWADRNISGMGRTLSFQGDFTRISHSGVGSYIHPDFMQKEQELICQAQAMHESLFAYHERSYNLMGRIDRKIGDRFRFSLGIVGDRLFVTNSVDNGRSSLIKLPIYLRWSTANHLLDPTQGMTIEFTTTPSLNVSDTQRFYLVQKVTESTYHPLNESRSVVLAQKLTLGLIWSGHLRTIPVPNRFLGGSEEELRGYRYRTVSPLFHGKPEGGRSAIYWTLETRLRVSKTVGLVPFFDIGNVYHTSYPTWEGKWFKSVGLGFRYFSFMGPFRLDLAFPLDRRKGIDPVYKVLVSIGQTF